MVLTIVLTIKQFFFSLSLWFSLTFWKAPLLPVKFIPQSHTSDAPLSHVVSSHEEAMLVHSGFPGAGPPSRELSCPLGPDHCDGQSYSCSMQPHHLPVHTDYYIMATKTKRKIKEIKTIKIMCPERNINRTSIFHLMDLLWRTISTKYLVTNCIWF